MKALLLSVNRNNWEKTKGYTLEEVPEPRIDERTDPKDSEQVILEPILSGVCGTDKGIWFRKAFRESILSHLEKDGRSRFIMGHETLARVVEMGSSVSRTGRLKIGQIVAAESHIYCGHCVMCLTGDQHVCENERIIGVNWDGVFAERVKLPANVLWPTDLNKIRPEVAAVQEPFGNAVHVCTPNMRNSDLGQSELRGKTVALFGCGTIGLFSILIARAMGAKKIIGIDPNPAQRAKAIRCGADAAFAPSDRSADEIKEHLGSFGADYCFEMSGFSSSVLQAIAASRRGGHIVLFGLSSGDLTIPAFEELITAGKRIHAIVGRRVFSTWEITKQLLEKQENGIQEMVWKEVLERGEDTITPLSDFTPEVFERRMLAHPKTLVRVGRL
jgi:threonine 3-dehydrogenase